MFFLLLELVLLNTLLDHSRPLVVHPDHLAAVPLPIFLAESVDKHALFELVSLIINLPLSLLGDLEEFLLDFTVDEHWDARQHDVEVVLVLEDLLDEGPESYGVPRFVLGVGHLRLVHQERKETLP